MKEKILVVEDDVAIMTGLVDLLTGEGFTVSSATDGDRALGLFSANAPDLVLLDIMIPGKSGYEVCKEIRKKNATVPVLMLTAKGQEVDKVVGLEIGADDYIVKPFGVNELLARVRAALRRSQAKPRREKNDDPFSFGDITVNPKTLTGTKKKKTFPVTPREVHLLQIFLEHDGEVVDRFTLLDEGWGIQYEGTTRTLDQHIAKLRQKIEDDPASPAYITTAHGTGYRFNSKGK
ncbi:MAG: response regulator transcription factor [Candidatus Omnitrophota bacterium]|nr:response regulator transcription factor [Candidatus Omnitrophota bacterium]MDZ4242224.1 response regulator transcription factor [Candidatus Omnitrophota bacterium]